MISFPPCKINLGLNVISKRSDGYHEIETCFFPIPWTDILEIIPANQLEFFSSGLEIPGNRNDNLCLKAYRLLQQDFNLAPVKIYLHKIIPTGAGLGGGSSDAAHTLRLLNDVFDLQLGLQQLKQYAAQLGSDCSFFLEDKPMMGNGRGEELSSASVNLHGKFVVLVKPDVQISTADAYAGVKPAHNQKRIKTIVEEMRLSDWKSELKNDFEDSIFQKYPVVRNLKESLYRFGATYASMSGSGSAVYGIFDKPVLLNQEFKDALCWSSTLS